jgi:uncharacterized protein (DUF1800 family)
MGVSDRERIAHVVRRLSMGPHPDLLGGLADTDHAISTALALKGSSPVPPTLPAPASRKTARPADIVPLIGWWVDQMASSPRLIEERLVWFWQDHFATSLRKVGVAYLMRQQQATIRQHATTSFADLLHAVAKDPAMVVFLDGITNTVGNTNENFGRECMELFTMGRDAGYTQADVVAASKSFSGWIVNLPGLPVSARLTAFGIAPWTAAFLPQRHDESVKTLLGHRGDFDMDQALDVILGHPSTPKFIATKLYRELVGLNPSAATVSSLAASFGRDYQIMPLVEAIVGDPTFTSDGAVRTRVRTPVEKLVGVLQAGEADETAQTRATIVVGALRAVDYVPFLPPNVGGFPSGNLLLGPHDLVGAFDLLDPLVGAPPAAKDVRALLARFGLFDVSSTTTRVLGAEPDPARRFALAATSPEYTVV